MREEKGEEKGRGGGRGGGVRGGKGEGERKRKGQSEKKKGGGGREVCGRMRDEGDGRHGEMKKAETKLRRLVP